MSWHAARPVLQITGALTLALLTGACQSSTVAGLHVRARPTTASPVVTSLGSSGTAVTITCVTRGEPVHGDTVWYRISRPRPGWVSGYYIHIDDNSPATTSC
ncbi:MAG: SH3 domain-containing protein [Pseudonocardiales bacterium]|nr:SH3 domain-containing protein [Pseudonocardiales bacterium]